MAKYIGEKVVYKNKVIGVVTDTFKENHKQWVVIDEDYEAEIKAVVLNFSNSKLPASYIEVL